jgi:hypothetical protein
MDRRESLRTLMVGTLAGASLGTAVGCETDNKAGVDEQAAVNTGETEYYGRTPEELAWDEKIKAEEYLNEHELATIAVLCDIILPATDTAGSAGEAGVPEFVEFIVKDLPSNQLPLRGGLMWLDTAANQRFNTVFKDCSNEQQMAIVEDIAYPDPDNKKPTMGPGIKFFSLIRNLTVTGYYTTKMGFDDLGYTGNYANIWDGVPPEVLAEHDVDYEETWLAKCVDQSKREEIAEWDEQGNLLT